MDRLYRDVHLRCHFAGQKSNFEPDGRMYVRSKWTPPPWLYPKEAKYRLSKMEEFVRKEFKKKKKVTENLLSHQHKTLRSLQTSSSLLVVQCDKNLGPALIEHEEYVLMVNRDHLLDKKSYTRLSEAEAATFAIETKRQALLWIEHNRPQTTKMERKFVKASLVDNPSPLPKFYATMKVHKSPLKTRPIVSCSGTLLENLGVWVDRKLQHFLPMFDSYFKSSEELKFQLDQMTLPDDAELFISDAVSMYTSIPTEHALNKITRFLRRHEKHKKEGLPYNAIIEGLGIIMRRCAFSFGDTFWQQESGTAMGTPPAPPYATIYFGLHEQKFLKRHRSNLLFYKRFIDDVFGIWKRKAIRDIEETDNEQEDESEPSENSDKEDERWDKFLTDLDGAEGLRWETSERSNKVDFMDLSLSISEGKIATSLYEKPSNRHLYIPSHSCHPPGMISGVVHGMVRRIMRLCSNQSDQEQRIRRFVLHLRARGHHMEQILPLVNAAIAKVRYKASQSTDVTAPDADAERRIFFHLPYHPDNPRSSVVQREWKSRVSRPPFCRKFRDIRNHKGVPIGIERLTVAYHRSHNLGNLLSYRDLRKRNGPSVSSIID